MLIELKYRGMLEDEVKTIVADHSMVSPTGGYDQAYADRVGKSYTELELEEKLGSYDCWEFESAKLLGCKMVA